MSFYTSLSGLKGAQTALSTVSNNLANVATTGFKKSRAQFGDMFASSPTQTTRMSVGQGTRLTGVMQQFSQGTLEATDKALDLAIAGEGFFIVRGAPPASEVNYTRSGEFAVDTSRNVVGPTGAALQVMPVDATGAPTATDLGSLQNLQLPDASPTNPDASLVNVSIAGDGLITATYADGTNSYLGKLALASFSSVEGLRPVGNAYWQSTGESGQAFVDSPLTGPLGTIRSGALERANVDVTEELVSLIAAQRNFQANAKAIETASNMTQTVFNIN